VITTVALGVAGCSDPASAPPTSSPSGTQSSTTSAPPTASADPTAEASAAALAAYRGFRAAQVEAGQTSDARNADLEKFAGDKALADERANLLQLADAGIVFVGAPALDPQVTGVDLGASPSVTITDCVDNTDWRPIHQATGESAAAPGQQLRVPATAVVRAYADRWVVMELTSDRSRSC